MYRYLHPDFIAATLLIGEDLKSLDRIETIVCHSEGLIDKNEPEMSSTLSILARSSVRLVAESLTGCQTFRISRGYIDTSKSYKRQSEAQASE